MKECTEPSQYIPTDIRRFLRKEVGYGCPNCRNPILDYHHFDPPWSIGKVHRKEGMIALCPTCHRLADGNRWSSQQLQQFKSEQVRAPLLSPFGWDLSKAVIQFGDNFFLINHAHLQFGRPSFSDLRGMEMDFLLMQHYWTKTEKESHR